MYANTGSPSTTVASSATGARGRRSGEVRGILVHVGRDTIGIRAPHDLARPSARKRANSSELGCYVPYAAISIGVGQERDAARVGNADGEAAAAGSRATW